MFESDLIIIGSGPIGAVFAAKCAMRGRRVLILEAGDAASRTPGEHLRNRSVYRSNPDQFFEEIGRRCHFFNGQTDPSGLPGANITEAVGGQSLIWTNNCPRPTEYLDQLCFLERESWERRLTEAEKLLRVCSDPLSGSVRQLRIEAHLLRHLPRRQVRRLPVAAAPLKDGNLSFTATKDILGSEYVRKSNITIQKGTRVIKLLFSGDRVDRLVTLDTSGSRQEYRSDNYVIAAGVFGTPRLLFDSGIRPPALGRYLHYHPALMAQVVLGKSLHAPAHVYDLPPRLYLSPNSSHPWHTMILRDIFPRPSSETVDQNRLVDLQSFAPIEIREENRMCFGSKERPFEVTLTRNDEEVMEKMSDDQHELARLLGRFRQGCTPFFLPSGMAHPMGTCRMGDNPSSSVVNSKGQVHGFKNLFVAGPALLSHPIAINPTLTCAAIALETADNIQ
jgi:C-glycoside oxidase